MTARSAGASRRALLEAPLLPPAAVLLLCGLGATARAAPPPGGPIGPEQTVPAAAELSSDVVFSATKRLQRVQEAPAIVRVFTRETIRRAGYRDLNQLLASIPQIERVDTGRYTYLLFNGVPFTMLALLDGVSLINNGDNFVNLERLVPIEIVRKVEVVLSPGSVLWGAHSLFGVVNIITREDPASSAQEVAFTAGWWNTFRAAHTVFGRAADLRFKAHVSVQSARGATVYVEDSELFHGIWGNSGETDDDVGLSLNAFAALQWRGLRLRLNALIVDEHTYALNEATGAMAPGGGNNLIESPTYTASIAYQRAIDLSAVKLQLVARADAYLQRYSDRSYFFPPSERAPTGWLTIDSVDRFLRFGGMVEGRARYHDFRTVLGFEGFRNSSTALVQQLRRLTSVDSTVVFAPHAAVALSAYGQQEWQAHRDLNLAVGARFNHADSYRAALLLQGHLVYEPIEGLFAKLNYSEGFRPPSFQQRFTDTPLQKGSLELSAARTRSLEAHAELYRVFAGSWRLTAQAGYTLALLDGLIGMTRGEPPSYYENLPRERVHTISGATSLAIGELLRLDLSLARHFPTGEADEPRRDFALTRLAAGATTRPWAPLSITARYGYTGSRLIRGYTDPQTYEARTLELDAYHELALTARYRLLHTGFVVSATLRNILFQDYDHTLPYTRMEGFRGPFPRPGALHGFVSIEWQRDLG